MSLTADNEYILLTCDNCNTVYYPKHKHDFDICLCDSDNSRYIHTIEVNDNECKICNQTFPKQFSIHRICADCALCACRYKSF